jgi:glycine/D-amino acid oxidase-like deaminating enzyme
MKPLRLTVLGSGSVGLAFAASYAKAGQQVTLLARGAAMAELRQQGIAVSGVCGEHRIEPGMLKVSDAEQPAAEDVACDVLVVATKAYQVGPVLRRLAQQAGTSLAPKAVLLLAERLGLGRRGARRAASGPALVQQHHDDRHRKTQPRARQRQCAGQPRAGGLALRGAA